MDRASLESLYREAVYELRLPDGRGISFHVGGAVPAVEGRAFALVTAHNPGSARPSDAENAAANVRLEHRLRGFEVLPASGRSPDGSHTEPSYAAFGIDRFEALGIAREFGQAAIVWFDGRRATLAWTGAAD